MRLWRSCTEQVAAFNADASRIATIGILSDGPGPGRVDARTIDGKHLGRYQVASGWFGSIGFETQTALLLEVNGRPQGVHRPLHRDGVRARQQAAAGRDPPDLVTHRAAQSARFESASKDLEVLRDRGLEPWAGDLPDDAEHAAR